MSAIGNPVCASDGVHVRDPLKKSFEMHGAPDTTEAFVLQALVVVNGLHVLRHTENQ